MALDGVAAHVGQNGFYAGSAEAGQRLGPLLGGRLHHVKAALICGIGESLSVSEGGQMGAVADSFLQEGACRQ